MRGTRQAAVAAAAAKKWRAAGGGGGGGAIYVGGEGLGADAVKEARGGGGHVCVWSEVCACCVVAQQARQETLVVARGSCVSCP